MKTNDRCRLSAFIIIPFILALPAPGPAQELEQLISSKVQVVDQQDWQILDCDTYRYGDKILYDNPNSMRLYENGYYRLAFRFSYFGEKTPVTPASYLAKRYSVHIPPSAQGNYRITAISPSGDSMSIYAVAQGKPGTQDTLRIQLLDDKNKLLADAVYPFAIHSNEPSANATAYLPMKIEFQPLYITLRDTENPNNRIERQLLPFSPDTINVNAREAFELLTEIEQQVYLNDQSYVLVANHEKDYGYKARLRWQGKALSHKSGSRNGLKAHLTTVPDPGATTAGTLNIQAIMTADLKQAGLDQQGKRVQQQYSFTAPDAQRKKIYQRDYLRQNPDALRSRTDPQGLRYLIDRDLPKIQYQLKEASQKIIQYYQPNKANAGQIQRATVPAKEMQQEDKAQSPAVRKADKTEVARANTRFRREAMAVEPREQVVTARPRYEVATTVPSWDAYYTLAIELSRQTDAMSHRTYLVTFRVIE